MSSYNGYQQQRVRSYGYGPHGFYDQNNNNHNHQQHQLVIGYNIGNNNQDDDNYTSRITHFQLDHQGYIYFFDFVYFVLFFFDVKKILNLFNS